MKNRELTEIEHIYVLCNEAGLEVMADMAEMVIDRGNLTNHQVRAGLEQLGVQELYDRIVGRAIDQLEDALAEAWLK